MPIIYVLTDLVISQIEDSESAEGLLAARLQEAADSRISHCTVQQGHFGQMVTSFIQTVSQES